MFIRSARLFLRPAWPEDWAELHAAIDDAAVVHNLARAPWPYRADDARAFVSREQDPRHPDFLVTMPGPDGARIIGCAGIVPGDAGAAELGYWIARSHPEAKLWPEDLEGQTRALEAMDYVVSTVHMQGFARMFRPANHAPSESDHDAVKARGHEIFAKGLAMFDAVLAGKDYLTGSFSVADAALFYVEFWWASRLGLALPANCAGHYTRMLARPAVARVMQAEGLTA